MDNPQNRQNLQRNIRISNVITGIYALVFCFIAALDGIGISLCWSSVGTLMDSVREAEADYVGGFAVIGGLLGAGTVTIFGAFLILILIACVVCILIFLTEGIVGYCVYQKLKNEGSGWQHAKGIKADAIVKIVVASLVIAPMAFLLFSAQLLPALSLIGPQVVVLVLSIDTLRMLSRNPL